jgi:hypothetical protein
MDRVFVVVDFLRISSKMYVPQDVIGPFSSEEEAEEYGEKSCLAGKFEVFVLSTPLWRYR